MWKETNSSNNTGGPCSTPGRVGYRDKDGTSVICVGNDYNPKKDGLNNNGSGGSSYPDGSGRGDYGFSGGSSSGYSGGSSSNYSSSSSIPAHTRGLDKIYNHSDVLGVYGNTDRNHNAHSKTVANIIDYCREFSSHCWGSNALDHKAGGAEGAMHVKAINLGKAGLDSNDAANLFSVLRDFNFNLDIINLSGNNIGDHGIACMMNGITCLNKQTLYKAPEWKPYSATFNTVQKVTVLNLSNVNMGDKGVEVITDALINGKILATKAIDVSGNNIYESGKAYFSKALEAVEQNIVVVTDKVTCVSKQALQSTIKGMLYIAKSNGISTKEVLTTDETIEHCKQGTWNVGKNVGYGLVKCFTGADTPIALYEMDLQTLIIKTVGGIFNPVKKPAQFLCITEETVFSVVDEEFANCLTGLDSGF